MKKIIAINCSPRTAWNTATLVREAAKGAEAIVKGYLDDAKSSGEKYKQRRDYDQKVAAHSLSAEAKIDAEYQLEEAEKEKKTK